MGQVLGCFVLLGPLLQEEFLLSQKKDILTQLPIGATGQKSNSYPYKLLFSFLTLWPIPLP